MREVVVMPTFARPEFLALALEKIDAAMDAPDDVRIYLDTSTEERMTEVEYVRDTYLPRAIIFHAQPHTPAPQGTWNILNSLKQGYDAIGKGLIFFVEEDVMVRPNFFNWHREQMATGNYTATCGRIEDRLLKRWGNYYTNPGSCLWASLVEQVIPHMNDEYYSQPREYLLKHFEPWEEMSILDDGLIRRVIRKIGGQVKYPAVPVCAHQGWKFYNNLDIYMNRGSVQERIAWLREAVARIKPTDRYAKDFEPF